jgi:hypothetical protein
VEDIRLVGSRAEGRASDRSDWDFRVETSDFPRLASDLPRLLSRLDPLVAQWDRLSPEHCWMLILPGPVKVDLIFPDEPYEVQPPWQPSGETIVALDAHFWDWMLWLASKDAAGKDEQVTAELEKAFDHLLSPLGVASPPASIAESVAEYRRARKRREQEFGVVVPRELEREVVPALPSL